MDIRVLIIFCFVPILILTRALPVSHAQSPLGQTLTTTPIPPPSRSSHCFPQVRFQQAQLGQSFYKPAYCLPTSVGTGAGSLSPYYLGERVLNNLQNQNAHPGIYGHQMLYQLPEGTVLSAPPHPAWLNDTPTDGAENEDKSTSDKIENAKKRSYQIAKLPDGDCSEQEPLCQQAVELIEPVTGNPHHLTLNKPTLVVSTQTQPRPPTFTAPADTSPPTEAGTCIDCTKSSAALSRSQAIPDPITDPNYPSRPEVWERITQALPKDLADEALTAYRKHHARVKNQNVMILVDLSGRESTEKRFYEVNLKTGEVSRHKVGSGIGPNSNRPEDPSVCSNQAESHRSPCGAFVTAENYSGQFGNSLRFDGLETSNQNARARTTVIHATQGFNEDENIRNYTKGCFGLNPDYTSQLIQKAKNGAFMYVKG